VEKCGTNERAHIAFRAHGIQARFRPVYMCASSEPIRAHDSALALFQPPLVKGAVPPHAREIRARGKYAGTRMRWDGVVEEWAAPIRESSADRSNALLRSAAMDGRFVILAITDDRWKKETARLGERAVGVAMGRRGNDVGSPPPRR